ncbi:MAG: hypothetical protein IPN24_18710 [Betaproteobacteria bacterium]|nr:hypothetical protein [Betaproteobacteria bacterium]
MLVIAHVDALQIPAAITAIEPHEIDAPSARFAALNLDVTSYTSGSHDT